MIPGGKASTDQIMSTQPGLIPQISGRLTNQHVNGSTVFVDHSSDHIYAYLMQDLTLGETLLAKHGHEPFLAMHGIVSKGYHTDNGRFVDKGFCDECLNNGQNIFMFCGIGSHHQNGIAEQKIKDLILGQELCCFMHKCMLPEYVTSIHWPFAIKCYEDRMNDVVHHADGRTPHQALLGLDAAPIDNKNFHTFGCSCYVLDHCLQSGNSMIPKWELRA